MEDILNIRGEKIPELPPEVSALVEEGRHREVKILEGASSRIFGGRVPHARTHVAVRFEDEENLITCVRLLRWSDDRLIALGSSIEWAWNFTVREGMEIRFAVDWHDPEFYRRRRGEQRVELDVTNPALLLQIDRRGAWLGPGKLDRRTHCGCYNNSGKRQRERSRNVMHVDS